MAEAKVISVRLKEELFEKVKFVSNKIRRSNNWVIREVLENYLEDLYDFEEAKRINKITKDVKLVRTAERKTGLTWDHIRGVMQRLHLIEFFSKDGRVLYKPPNQQKKVQQETSFKA